MHIVGITGGMGSGKSTAAVFFNELGIVTYDSDRAARCIMQENQTLRSSIVRYFGKPSYKGDQLDADFLANKVFTDELALDKLNSLVHPLVDVDFKSWVVSQKGPYCLKESALLFESGAYSKCHSVVLVRAPFELRIERIKKRSDLNRAQILNRLRNQLSDHQYYNQCHMVIENDSGLEILRERVKKTHIELLNLIRNGGLSRSTFCSL